MSDLYKKKIYTNHHWRQFKCRNEVPEKVLKDEFDYQDEDASDRYILYKNQWYHLDQFMRFGYPFGGDPPNNEDWDGGLNFSAWDGLIVKVSEDQETYKIAYFTTVSNES